MINVTFCAISTVRMPNSLAQTDRLLSDLVKREIERQQESLSMIPSENYASPAVLRAMGTPLANKYAEGYPGQRYYTGNQFIDQIESLATKQVQGLFGVEHANVQPHSGSTANQAVFLAFLNPGDKILSMSLAHGGHLTHGSPHSFTGKLYQIAHYGVRQETEQLDYNQIERLAHQEKPQLIISGASSYPRQVDFDRITKIANEVGAIHLADISHTAGLIVAGVHPTCRSAHVVTTTTHKTMRGPRGAIILCQEKYANRIDRAVFPGMQGGPMEHVIAAKAVCFAEATRLEFRDYQKQVVANAKALAKTLAEGSARLISGGTDTHLILVDAASLEITGGAGADALAEAGIYTNKNVIPFDTRSPIDPSGIRLGTPAPTTRGMKEPEMEQVGSWIIKILKDPNNLGLKVGIKEEVRRLTAQFPIYEVGETP